MTRRSGFDGGILAPSAYTLRPSPNGLRVLEDREGRRFTHTIIPYQEKTRWIDGRIAELLKALLATEP